MNAIATDGDDDGSKWKQMFCLRQRDSNSFWDGRGWAESVEAARAFLDLDHALNAARHIKARALDLFVLFPRPGHTLVIPLG